MSKFVNIEVSTTLSTDFFIEVSDEASEEEIKELAKKEVVLPNLYPEVINKILKERMGININGIDTLLKSWNNTEINYKINI
jgi:hypothetical protein